MFALGDSHNFGKKVTYLGNDVISKPRNIYWEWVFLGLNSPLRPIISEYFKNSGTFSPYSALPNLDFFPFLQGTDSSVESCDAKSFLNGGTVKKLNLLPPHGLVLFPEDFEKIGCALGFMAWLGMGDLHNENIVFGIQDSDQRLVLGPVDIESVFDDLYLLSQSHLLPSKELSISDAGLLKLLTFMTEFPSSEAYPAVLFGFLRSLDVLLSNETKILNTLGEIAPMSEAPIRVIVRPTRQYYSLLGTPALRSPPDLAQSELEQLERGDIPFFFRTLNDPHTILFFKEQGVPASAEIDERRRNKVLVHARQWTGKSLTPRNNQDKLRKSGTLQLARFLTRDVKELETSYKGISLTVTEDNLYLAYQETLGSDSTLSLACTRGRTR